MVYLQDHFTKFQARPVCFFETFAEISNSYTGLKR